MSLRTASESLVRGLGLEPGEGRRLVLMGSLVGVLYCGYTIAKILRDALFLGEFGALSLPYAYVAVALASAGLVWFESRWARRFTQVGAARFNQYLAIACSIAAALAFPVAHRWTAALFYVWTGSQAMMLLPHFWVLALDLWDSRRARRVFPILAGCGLIGGLAGGAFAGWASPLMQRIGLMWTIPVFLFGATLLTRHLEAFRTVRQAPGSASTSPWTIIRRSPYIMVLVVALALSVIVGTLVDFEFKYFIQHRYPSPHALTQFLGRFYVGLNALSLLFQFGAAGWLMQRFGLGFANGVQPASVLALAPWFVMAPGLWVIVILRWTQGVLSQTLGKSSNEIYFTAIRPSHRRRVKPAIDMLVERWSDALVGVLLVVALHVMHLPVGIIAVVTAGLTGVWVAVLVVLDRRYGHAFRQLLSSRWIEAEDAPMVMRIPAARRALLEALAADDEHRIVLALGLTGQVKDERIVRAVRGCLGHSSPRVRAAAVAAMESLGMADTANQVPALLTDPDEDLRHAAMRYLLLRGPHPVEFARRVLAGDDDALKAHAVDVLFDTPCEARAALTPEWIDALLSSARPENILLAAQGLGAMAGEAPVRRLRGLLDNPDPDVRRAALQSAVRRPSLELADALLPMLVVPGLHYEARLAVAAIGNPVVPALERMMNSEPSADARTFAANALAQIGTHRAVKALLSLVRSTDLGSRHVGLRALARVRVRLGTPVLPRSVAHRLFLRELRDYRDSMDPATALEAHAAPEVHLLGECYRESADRALERAIQALACWYDPQPLIGVLERLLSRDPAVSAPALEFLEHVLPRSVFRPVRRVFEEPAAEAGDDDADPLARWIEMGWNSEDGWLRACAVRASRFSPLFDTSRFSGSADEDPDVRAEVLALVPPGGASLGAAC